MSGTSRRGRDEPGEGFARIRPPSERVLRRGDTGHLADAGADAGRGDSGRAALFSAGRRGTIGCGVAVRCDRCAQRSVLDVRRALRTVLPLAVLAPWRAAPLFARCPACARRSWLAVEVGG